MNAIDSTVQGSFLSITTRFAAKVMRIGRPRRWRHRARASEVLDAVLATASDAVFFVDARGKMRDCNFVAEQMFERDRSEMIGRGIALYLPSLAFSALRRRAKGMGHDSLSMEMPGRLETLATSSSGSAFPVSVAVRSLSVLGNKGCIVRIRDDSRREADRQQLRRLADQLTVAKSLLERQSALCENQIDRRTAELSRIKESAESANKIKSDRLTELSRELCEPLHQIIHQTAYGKNILEPNANDKLLECLKSIGSEATTLSLLVNQLIQTLRPERGPTSSTSGSNLSAISIGPAGCP